MFGKGFDATKLKASLRLASSRFDVATHKKAALMKQNMREIALLLAEDPPKEESARIRTERLIKDDYKIEAYEILQLECQLLVERVGLLKHSKGVCPPDLVTTVSDLIYAAPRCDEVTELQEIKKQLEFKFGKQFALDADSNANNVVSQRIVEKLSLAPPTAYMVQTYMSKICKLHEVEYEPTLNLTLEEALEPVAAPIGYSVPVARGTGIAVDKEAKFEAENATLATTGTNISSSTNPEFIKEPPVVPAFAFASAGEISNLTSNDITDEVEDSKPKATAPSAAKEQPEEEHQARSIGCDKEEGHFEVQTGLEVVDVEDATTGQHQDEVSIFSNEQETKSIIVTAPPAPEEEEVVATVKSQHCMAVTGLSSTAKIDEAQSDDVTSKGHEVAEESVAKSMASDVTEPTTSETEAPHYDSICTFQFHEDTANTVTEDLPAPASTQDDALQSLRNRLAGLSVTQEATTSPPPTAATPKEVESVESLAKDIPAEEVVLEKAEREEQCFEPLWVVDPTAIDQAEAPCETASERQLQEDTEHIITEDNATNERQLQEDTEHTITEGEATSSSFASNEAEAINESQKDTKEDNFSVFVAPTRNIVETGVAHQEDDRALPAETRDTAPAPRDPAKDPEHITGAALAGGAVGFTVGGPIGGFLGAAGVAHLAANKKGKAADLARKCGKKVTKMTSKLVKEIEKASK